MSKRTIVLSTSVFIFLFCHAVTAAVVEVDVTVKSVDSKARGITVTYETKLGQKAIDLDVSRKAEITVNGESGTLDSVKPGQKAKVTFERDLQVVTQIIATGKGSDPGKEVYRLTLQLSEFGDGKFRIEKTSEPPKDDFQGTPFKLSRWPKTKATKGKDGAFRLVHDFSDPDDLGVLALGPPTNVTIDKEAGVLVFTSGPMPDGSAIKSGSIFEYGKKFRLPLTIIMDITEYGDCGFAAQIADPSRKIGLLQCRLAAGLHDLEKPFEVQILWVEGDGNKNGNVTQLYDKKDITLDAPFEKTIRLPVPNARITEPMCPKVVKMFGGKATKVSRLEVRGKLAPMFGLGMGEKQGMVFVANLIPNGLAEKAGFQVGDVLLTINGKKPQTMQEAADMLGRVPIGDKVVFSVQRGEKTEELRVVAE